MDAEGSEKALYRAAWKHIDAEEFSQAEAALRQVVDLADPNDPLRLWELSGLMASVLNSLSRPDEATEMLRRALSEALRVGPANSAVGVARYMLANQYLIYGDPRDALTQTLPVPVGNGHIQCLLHSIAAQALWKLNRHDEAQNAAKLAIDAAPTDERRSDLTRDLRDILNAG
jgi:tetratricopeptide (TPR) repeat protein